MPPMLLRCAALAAGALVASAALASCFSSSDPCDDEYSLSCSCFEVCSAQLESCRKSGQHDRECSIEYEACIDGCQEEGRLRHKPPDPDILRTADSVWDVLDDFQKAALLDGFGADFSASFYASRRRLVDETGEIRALLATLMKRL